MYLDELNNIFCGNDFFYNNIYLGVVKNIYYDFRGFYILHFYNNPNIQYIPESYMSYYYKMTLMRIRMNLLASKGITSLVHFTPISNLEGIFESGLRSRFFLDSNNSNYTPTDTLRLDDKTDFICNSISFPNYKMFYSKRMSNLMVKWAVLTINSQILIDKFDTEFYRMNAASSDPTKCRFDACSNDALNDMFYLEDRDPDLPSNFTTNPQAEVLIKDYVDPAYIECIDTLGYDDVAYSLARNSNVYYRPDSKLFTYRKDYKRWQYGG